MELAELIELGDPDELLREIDRRCAQHDWDGLIDLRDRCRRAVDRGKQLWGVGAHAEYRVALEAPGEFARHVIEAPPSAIAIGPLPEVIACRHIWKELDLPEGPLRAVTAYECVARGEDLSDDGSLESYKAAFELPFALQSWEPQYAAAEYRETEGLFPVPVVEVLSTTKVAAGTAQNVTDGAVAALWSLVRVWADESNGAVNAVAVSGGLAEVVAGLCFAELDVAEISFQDALALMAWAGASGGAQGRRSGMAAGRSKTWWTLAALVDASDEWPIPPDELGKRGAELQWYTWDPNNDENWQLKLIVVDPIDDVTFAIDATDRIE